MTYPTSFNIIVIVLSATLFVFLVLSIIAIAKFIQLINSAKRTTAKAEKLTEDIASISRIVSGSAAVSAITSLFKNASDFVKRKKGDK